MVEPVFHRYHLPPETTVEMFELHQMAQTFRLETVHREKLEQYYRWYQETAAQNQRDLVIMRTELNLLERFG